MKTTSILEILKRVSFTQIKAPLGRWNIHNNRETTLKIKYANEDNCGISGINYKQKIQQNNDLDDDNVYIIYMMGYESSHK